MIVYLAVKVTFVIGDNIMLLNTLDFAMQKGSQFVSVIFDFCVHETDEYACMYKCLLLCVCWL